jgi:hypothetical protein
MYILANSGAGVATVGGMLICRTWRIWHMWQVRTYQAVKNTPTCLYFSMPFTFPSVFMAERVLQYPAVGE